MKVGDLVRYKMADSRQPAVVMSEIRHGVNNSFVDIFLNGRVVKCVNLLVLKVISESR